MLKSRSFVFWSKTQARIQRVDCSFRSWLVMFDYDMSFEPVAPSLGDLLYLIERVLDGDPDPEFDFETLAY